MSNNKQSSVEWLMNELTSTWYDKNSVKDIFEQAKAMHKEELKESYFKSVTYSFETFEHYYNETYGGNDE